MENTTKEIPKQDSNLGLDASELKLEGSVLGYLT